MKIYNENENGTITSEGMSIPMVEGNRHYNAILAEVKAGEAEIIPWEGSEEQISIAAEEHIASLEAYIEEHIQEPVDNYNNTHGLAFGGVHNCANYLNNPEYSHYDFCYDVWNFNVAVWEAARAVQAQVQNGEIEVPELLEFRSMLPVYDGTV